MAVANKCFTTTSAVALLALSVFQMQNKTLRRESKIWLRRFRVEPTEKFPSKLFTLRKHRFTKTKILCREYFNLNEDFKSDTQDNFSQKFLFGFFFQLNHPKVLLNLQYWLGQGLQKSLPTLLCRTLWVSKLPENLGSL